MVRFSQWIGQNCPSYQDKLNACHDALVDAASEVDISYESSNLSIGKNRGGDVAVLSEDSKGRCIVHLNTKQYDGMDFPHIVFINMRQKYQDRASGKSVPSVVDTVTILFEAYKSNTEINRAAKVRIAPKKTVSDINLLVQQMRQWNAKLELYSLNNYSAYLQKSGIKSKWITEDEMLCNMFRIGHTIRYGRYVTLPLRYLAHNTFMGFQRIYDSGAKIMIKDFNPNGLCGYLATDEAALEPSGVKLLIFHEGWANAILSHFMCKKLNMTGVVNVAALYADNLPILFDSVDLDFKRTKHIVNFFDNDEKGLDIAEICKSKVPRTHIDCFSRNDLRALVQDYSFEYAFKEFKERLKNALKGVDNAP